jgi:carboxypeptidase PM20D1
VGRDALLFHWKGTSESKPPILLLAHQDVVPVDDEKGWTHPPFSGAIADGFVWGRGALDDKAALIALSEAVERLLESGFKPSRSIFIAFGDDEEVGGEEGAKKMAALLEMRGVKPAFVLDEGLAVTRGVVPGISGAIASIGIAEKGYLTLELSVAAEGGHSSMPPRPTAIGRLSRALDRIEQHPMPTRLDGARRFLEYLAPELPLLRRVPLANLWLFGPLVSRQLAAAPPSDAIQRTTTAATLIQGGVKENVLAQSARAMVNFRILPGDTIQSVIDHVGRVIGDPLVRVTPRPGHRDEPSAVARTDAEGFELVHKTARAIFEDAVVAPAIVLGATDARHYRGLTTDAYRFNPFELTPPDLKRVHGTDERVAVSALARAVRFYYTLITTASH